MLSWVVIASEVSHVFCCVLPSIFSIVTILVGMGILGAMPLWMDSFHEIMHDYEIPLIMMSGAVVMLGWGVHLLAKKLDCHDTGCCHKPCDKKKQRSLRILKIATFLFIANVTIYTLLHSPMDSAQDHHDEKLVSDKNNDHDHGHHH